MGIALFHLLPESKEKIEDYLKTTDSIWKNIPLPYFFVFLSYSLILFVEKIAFDSHALIEHDHDHGGHSHDNGKHSHDHENQEETELRSSKQKDDSGLGQNLLAREENNEDESDSDVEEEALKNVVSSRGKFASFMQMRNSLLEAGSQRNYLSKPDKALHKASQILRQTLSKSHQLHHDLEDDDMKYMVNPKNVHIDDEKPAKEVSANKTVTQSQMKPTSNLTPYLLLIALSFHGFFEGLALGIQTHVKDTLFLAIAILAHKWAEAFTLV